MARQGRTLPKEGIGISHPSHQQKWDFNFFLLRASRVVSSPHPSSLSLIFFFFSILYLKFKNGVC